jgi:hypothetical protein
VNRTCDVSTNRRMAPPQGLDFHDHHGHESMRRRRDRSDPDKLSG